MTVTAQYVRFVEDLPAGHPPVLPGETFQPWALAYLATDPASGSRNPPAVKVPNGPLADVIEAWQGRLAYDPAGIECPLLVVRGEWDSLCTNADAAWLLGNARQATVTRDAKIPKGTHLMLLEESRHELHRVTGEFLKGE